MKVKEEICSHTTTLSKDSSNKFKLLIFHSKIDQSTNDLLALNLLLSQKFSIELFIVLALY